MSGDGGGARPEHELKARLPDGAAALRRRLREAGWRPVFRGEMRDRRLDTAARELEARDEVVRLRRYLGEDGREKTVLGWKGPGRDASGFKVRDELEVGVEDEARARALLGRLGYTEVTLAIDRRVELYEKEGVTLRIEEYPRMDVLAEIEGDPEAVEERLPELGLPRAEWRPWPLAAFVARYEERTGEAARIDRGEPA